MRTIEMIWLCVSSRKFDRIRELLSKMDAYYSPNGHCTVSTVGLDISWCGGTVYVVIGHKSSGNERCTCDIAGHGVAWFQLRPHSIHNPHHVCSNKYLFIALSAYISFGVDYLVVVTRWKHQLQTHVRTTPRRWRITGAVWSYLAGDSVTITTPHWSLTTQLADGPISSVRSSWHPSVFEVCSSTTLSK